MRHQPAHSRVGHSRSTAGLLGFALAWAATAGLLACGSQRLDYVSSAPVTEGTSVETDVPVGSAGKSAGTTGSKTASTTTGGKGTSGGATTASSSTTAAPPDATTTTTTTGGTGTPTTAGDTGGGVATTTTTSGPTTTTTSGPTTTTTGGCQDFGPDLSANNTWAMSAQYYLQAAGLPPLNQAFTDIDSALNTVNNLGLVQVPTALLELFNILSEFDVVFNQLDVTSTLTLTPTGPGLYVASEVWTDVEALDPNGNLIDLNSGSVTITSPDPYAVAVCMPTGLFADHGIGGALAGLLTPLLDGIVLYESNGQFQTLAALLDYTFNQICAAATGIGGYGICIGYIAPSLESEVNSAIASLALPLGIANVSGTATIDPGGALIGNGFWEGSDNAGAFPGAFCAVPSDSGLSCALPAPPLGL